VIWIYSKYLGEMVFAGPCIFLANKGRDIS
jgi:hypothetical protein